MAFPRRSNPFRRVRPPKFNLASTHAALHLAASEAGPAVGHPNATPGRKDYSLKLY